MARMHASQQARPHAHKLTAVPEAPNQGHDTLEEEADEQALPNWRERLAKRLGSRYLVKLLDHRELVRQELSAVPERMQKLTHQATLVLELVDDFRAKRYRAVPWHSIAVAAAALLYAVSPTDVVPDFIPGLGALDDVIVISLGMRLIRKDLTAYIAFKGYDRSKYF